MYTQEPELRKSRRSFPELDIYARISVSYFNVHPIDIGNVKAPITFRLENEWKTWHIPLTNALIRKARSVDASLKVLDAFRRQFAPENANEDTKLDQAWRDELLNKKKLSELVEIARNKVGPFESAIAVKGETVNGSDDFVPDVREWIQVVDEEKSSRPISVELWISSLKYDGAPTKQQ